MTWTEDDSTVGARLKLLLDPPPPGIDAASATHTARRALRRRHRYTGAAAAVLLVVAGTATGIATTRYVTDASPGPAESVAAAPPDYDRCVVKQPDGPNFFQVVAADPTGTYLAGIQEENGAIGAAVLHKGTVTRIAMPVAVSSVTPARVDRTGTVVGWATPADHGPNVPWIYRNGVVTMLPLPAGFDTGAAVAINARGDVVGSLSKMKELSPGGPRIGIDETGVVWRAGALDKPVVTAPGPGFSLVDIGGITDDGTIVGRAGPASGAGVAPYAWRLDGAARRLDLPSGYGYARVLGARGRWAYGQVWNAAPGELVVARWNLETGGVDLFSDLPPGSEAADVSTTGVLLANAKPAPGKAFVIDTDGVVHMLPNAPSQAVSISDDGRTISGDATYPGRRPAIWTCG